MKILITDNTIEMDPPMSPAELTDIMLQCIIQSARHTVDKAPEEKQFEVAEKLYDGLNTAFTRALEDFIPDKELRPDLTAEAILAMENALIKEKEAELDQEDVMEDGKEV